MKIIFSEGKDFLTYSHHQEYSVLQNEYARLFVSVIQSHAELFHINNQQYQLEQNFVSWCGAMQLDGMGPSDCPKNRLEKCRERMRMICMEYLPDWKESADFSIEMLWAAANAAYQASLL